MSFLFFSGAAAPAAAPSTDPEAVPTIASPAAAPIQEEANEGAQWFFRKSRDSVATPAMEQAQQAKDQAMEQGQQAAEQAVEVKEAKAGTFGFFRKSHASLAAPAMEQAQQAKNQAMEQAGEAGEQAEDVKEAKEGALGLLSDMKQFATTPVAGSLPIQVLYVFMMACSLCLFLWSVITIAPTWVAPVTILTNEHMLELEMPDIFVCYPAKNEKAFYEEEMSVRMFAWMIGGKECKGIAESPTLAEITNLDLPTSCATNDMKTGWAHPVSYPITKTLGFPESKANDGEFTVPVGERARKLENLMPTYKYEDAKGATQTAEATCYEYSMNGKKVAFDSKALMWMGWELEPHFVKSADGASATFGLMYLVEQGTGVVNATDDTEVNVTGHFFPSMGSITQVEISVTMIKNELMHGRQAQWKPHYTFTTTSARDKVAHSWPTVDTDKKWKTGHLDGGWTEVYIFKFQSFVVPKVHIRSKTMGEIWTDIGGLWGGAALVMTLLFAASGHVRSTDSKELMVFRFQTTSMKKKVLHKAGASKKESAEDVLRREVAEMKDKLAEMANMLIKVGLMKSEDGSQRV